MMSRSKARLFLDSNVITGGLVSLWGLDKAILSICAANISRMVLAEVVQAEVEHNLLRHADTLPRTKAEQLLEDYRWLIEFSRPESILRPNHVEVLANRHLIRHEADVPVLLSAIQARPDWLLTHNTKHFNESVAKRTGLRIATPADFFRELSTLLSL